MTEHSERYWEARWRDERAENDRLQAENDRLQAENAILRKEYNEGSAVEIVDLRTKNVHLRTEIERLRADKAELLAASIGDAKRYCELKELRVDKAELLAALRSIAWEKETPAGEAAAAALAKAEGK